MFNGIIFLISPSKYKSYPVELLVIMGQKYELESRTGFVKCDRQPIVLRVF
jgi:hypothetical protein